LNRILKWVESSDRDITLGLCFLFGMFISNSLKAVLDGQQYFHGRRVGLNVRSIIISEVYAKSLRRAAGVSAPSQQQKSDNGSNGDSKKDDGKKGDDGGMDTSVGKIVTLMSVDSERIRE
jgi:hypothetical protein